MNTSTKIPHAHRKRFASRRRGVSMVLFAFSLPVIFGCLAIVIDMGNLYNVRARTQRAADAAALAGAIVSTGNNSAKVVETAQIYSGYNEFPISDPSVSVVVTQGTSAGANSSQSINSVRVVVTKQATVYFSPIMEGLLKHLGLSKQAVLFSRTVSSQATAEKVGTFSLNVPGFYGIADPTKAPANLSVFGPYSNHQWGDPYSVLYNEDGTPNTQYDPKGYQYSLTVNSNFKSSDNKLYVQIFDPDSYISGTSKNPYDEYHGPNPANKTSSPTGNNNTKTQYDLYAVSDTPGVEDRLVATQSYADDAATNEKWTTPPGFDVNLNDYPNTKFKLRVHSTDGSTENGFLLRAGPKEGLALSDTEWNAKYGDVGNTNPSNIAVPIQADGSLQMNFTQTGTVKVALGYVGKEYAGKQIKISKFDVDVGSQSIVYTNSSLPGQTFPGSFPTNRNDTWSEDPINVPSNYDGGVWYAEYVAGQGDTSNWSITGKDTGDGAVYLSK